jgi:hypothetical protein
LWHFHWMDSSPGRWDAGQAWHFVEFGRPVTCDRQIEWNGTVDCKATYWHVIYYSNCCGWALVNQDVLKFGVSLPSALHIHYSCYICHPSKSKDQPLVFCSSFSSLPTKSWSFEGQAENLEPMEFEVDTWLHRLFEFLSQSTSCLKQYNPLENRSHEQTTDTWVAWVCLPNFISCSSEHLSVASHGWASTKACMWPVLVNLCLLLRSIIWVLGHLFFPSTVSQMCPLRGWS